MASSRSSASARVVVGLVIAAVSIASYLSRRSTNELTGETQFVKLTPGQEIALGVASAPQLTRQFGGASPDARLSGYVSQVGARLVRQSAASKTGYRFQFTVLADRDTVNAFALPGGPVFITEALLARMTNEAQLAGVLGHEIGHVVGRHGAERLAKAELTQGLVGATVFATADPDSPGASRAKAALAAVTAQLIAMKFGREDELESDTLGVRFMHEAGYDARQMGEVMQVLKAAGGGRTPEFFSTHPDPDNRLARIDEAVARLGALHPELGVDAYRENVLAGLASAARPPAPMPEAPPRPRPRRERGQAEPTVSREALPPEAQAALRALDAEGPGASPRGGREFENREGRLPYRPGGYYLELDVTTPGGPARLVTGAKGERYYAGPDGAFLRVAP
ncbi:MAG: M48 family metalloprotease [Myxococcaceae bacterium]|jgi:predicted Zn-dependent protease|nr:M48 family metalloprotease [Myxococcaceae bacterium]MCA3012034.1 M48 family metalloprotease [Myxococcaceae bacterium]